MSHFIRMQYGNPDDCYFLTAVTKNRIPYFASEKNRLVVYEEWCRYADKAEGEIIAYVVLPDHFHSIIRQGNRPFSKWMSTYKRSVNYSLNPSTGTVWQPRFWEHRIRDNEDLIRAIEYIHFNPVKHGLTKSPYEYEHSSFNQYVAEGLYEREWSSAINEDDDIYFSE